MVKVSETTLKLIRKSWQRRLRKGRGLSEEVWMQVPGEWVRWHAACACADVTPGGEGAAKGPRLSSDQDSGQDWIISQPLEQTHP